MPNVPKDFDPDSMLTAIREAFAKIQELAYTDPLEQSRLEVTNLAVRVSGYFQRLDDYLTQPEHRLPVAWQPDNTSRRSEP